MAANLGLIVRLAEVDLKSSPYEEEEVVKE